MKPDGISTDRIRIGSSKFVKTKLGIRISGRMKLSSRKPGRKMPERSNPGSGGRKMKRPVRRKGKLDLAGTNKAE